MFHVSSVVSVASDLFDLSIHFLSFFIISPITLLFLLLDIFNFRDVVENTLRTPAEDLGTLAENEPPTSYMSPTTTSSQRLMSNTPRSPRASNGSLMTSTTMTSPSARRSSTRAEDEPITLKKKACRPVCRRQSVIVERGDPLFAQVSSAQNPPMKLRETPLRVNRLGLSWSDKENKFSLTVKQRYENTNSKRITTEEVYKI